MMAAKKRFHVGVSIVLFLLFLTPSNVAALVNESAAIVEAYAYRAYGQPTIKTGDGGDGDWFDGDETTASSSAFGNVIMFTGRQYDSETGNYSPTPRIQWA